MHTPLPNRALLRLSGDDRHTFLQGLISNDINLCQPGKAIYAALLTPQGKFLHDLFITATHDAFLIDAEAAHLADLAQRLTRHKLRARITIEDISNDFTIHAAWSGETISADYTYVDPRLPELGTRHILSKSALAANAVTFEAYDQHRLILGVADGSRDMILEKSTLLEGNFDLVHGISWTKGCYMGQELTARTHYRGLVKKRLHPVTLSGPIEPGTPIFLAGGEIGEMRSSSGTLGLAILNVEKTREAIDQRQILTSGDTTLSAYLPTWAQTKKSHT